MYVITSLNGFKRMGLIGSPPSDHCSLLGAFNEGDPLGCLNEQN